MVGFAIWLHPPNTVGFQRHRAATHITAALAETLSHRSRELVHRRTFASRAQARAAIFEWIEVFYNRERCHSALGFKSPVDFENQIN